MAPKEFFAAFLSFFCQKNRFGFPHGIADHALLMETTQRVPVVSLPGSSVTVQGEEKKREDHLVDSVFVVVHAGEDIIFSEEVQLARCRSSLKRI
jgi:hypothetical protein